MLVVFCPLCVFKKFISKMFLEMLLRFQLTLSEMVDSSQKWIMAVSQDLKSGKIIVSFSLSFIIVSLFVLLLGAILAWSPAIWNSKYLNKEKQEYVEHIPPILDITPYTVTGATSNVERIALNFLPDSSDIQILDDDTIPAKNLPDFKQKDRKEDYYKGNEQEAEIALRSAIRMKEIQKFEKAQRLFQHALALYPLHPDILNHYGEFVEEEQKDVIKADHLYTRALIVCPEHSRALVNRQRTLPVVDELDEKQLGRIDSKRDRLIDIPQNDPSLKRMKKEAYFQHIHHTVAIEGNTMTLAETRMVVETRMAVPGKSILEHNEILGLEAALRFINNTLVSKVGAICVEDILHIHKRVLGHADPIQAGSFRKTQVFVGEHTPPAASDVMDLMEDFVDWLNSEIVQKMHPVKQSALAHYKLVFIHPFVDGNGRTSRLLMNLILMRAGYPPVIIRKQDRALYYEYLQLANEGDIRPFVRFIAECTERTLDVYLYATEYGMSGVKALEGQENENARIIEM